MTEALIDVGMVSLALGAVSGYGLALAVDRPAALARARIAHPGRIRQLHLDWIVMGLVLIAVGVAVPDLPTWACVATLAGAIVNPLLFVPLALTAAARVHPLYRAVTLLSFTALSAGLVGAAAHAVITAR